MHWTLRDLHALSVPQYDALVQWLMAQQQTPSEDAEPIDWQARAAGTTHGR
jgi:hypothetical protein